MFEQLTGKYEGNNSPMDAPDDGRAEWVADNYLDVFKPRMMRKALDWDAEQTGCESVFHDLANWVNARMSESENKEYDATCVLQECLENLAQRYADQVLWPQYLAKVKNGDLL